MNIYLNHTEADRAEVTQIKEQLLTKGYDFSDDIEDCDYVLSFFSHTYLSDIDSVRLLTYAACSLRKEFILVAINENLKLPTELEMLSAKYGLIKPGELLSNISHRVSKAKSTYINYPVKNTYVFKPFEADSVEDADYAFVSYAHSDAQQIYELIKPLYEQGWKLWYDEGIKTTNRYISDIANAIKKCKAFLLFVTEQSINRSFVVEFELAYAKYLGKPIIPVLVEMPSSLLPADIDNIELIVPDRIGSQLSAQCMARVVLRKAVPPKDKKGEEYDLTGLSPLEGFEYAVHGEEVTITKCIASNAKVKIPEQHCGLPVSRIDAFAFYECEKLRRVVLPNSIEDILGNVDGLTSGYWRKRRFVGLFCSRPIEISRRRNALSLLMFAFCFACICTWGFLLIYNITQSVSVLGEDLAKGSVFTIVLFLWLIPSAIILFFCLSVIPNSTFLFFGSHHVFQNIMENPFIRRPEEMEVDNPYALLLQMRDSALSQNLLNELKADGYSIISETDTSIPIQMFSFRSDCNAIVPLVDKELLSSVDFARLLRDALKVKKPVILVYIDSSPEDLPLDLRISIGQEQGIFYSDAEFDAKLRMFLQSVGCYQNPLNNYTYKIDGGNIILQSYQGKSNNVSIPRQVSDKCVTQFGKTFRKHPNLYTIVIPGSVHEIEKDAFRDCGVLSNVTIIDGVIAIQSHAFQDCHNLRMINIPDSIIKIGGEAFRGCNSLERVVIPDGVTEIEIAAFNGCYSLEEIVIPNSVKVVQSVAFGNCINIKKVVIPDTTDVIEQGAFIGCCSLECAIISNRAIEIHPTAFTDCPNLTIHAHAGSNAETYAKEHNIPVFTPMRPKTQVMAN